MKNKKEVLEKCRVNFDDFFNNLKKRKEIIEKEKVWVLFKNADTVKSGLFRKTKEDLVTIRLKIFLRKEKIRYFKTYPS